MILYTFACHDVILLLLLLLLRRSDGLELNACEGYSIRE